MQWCAAWRDRGQGTPVSWLHEDLGTAHEGWLGYRLGRDVAEPGGVRVAGEVLGAVVGAGPEVIDALVPACACGWHGVPIVLDGPCADNAALRAMEEAHTDRGRGEWETTHLSWVLRDVPPGALLDDLDAPLDRVGALVDDRPLAALVLLRQATSRADRLAHQAADIARGAGTTWEDIGQALGVTRQAAAERFRRPAPAPPATYTLLCADHELVPGVAISDPGSPLTWTDLDADTRAWARTHGYGTDTITLYVSRGHLDMISYPRAIS